MGRVIAHEQGHIAHILNNVNDYMTHLGEWNSLNCQAWENRNHRYVVPAKAAEDTFVKRKDRLKQPYKRNKYDKKWWRDWVDTKLGVQ
ncbi:hypothetical protein [Paraflavitalea speifideaquila]|uniref:hypothetical protein n=1 Tax=Paraflavitalea speifideaquila TaxID=3076558 RepID=UPI0028E6F5D4|nr:hypothetical protein [Paraflavitalea speifideiaquila]